MVDRPGKIVCVGRNYREHAAELGNTVPDRPLIFLKPPSALIGDGETIVLPSASQRVEHEGEIGIVVGARLKGAGAAAARAAVGGIVCVNDVTARDLQNADGQWTRAKGFDTFCPAGPRVLEVGPRFDLDGLEVFCRVNGALRQHARATEMVFGIPAILAFVSGVMTLEPGDLVATGTPSGVGPLADGDVVEVEIPGVGTLRNPVRSQAR